MQRKTIAYTRCSTQEQVDSGLGLTAQTERIRAYCTMKNLALMDIIEDAGVSGGKPLASREGGRRLFEAIKKHRADAVVILRLDRMFRNAGDCLNTVEKWERAGLALHIVDLGGNAIDTTSAAGRFMLVVLAGTAEMERNLGRERTRSALAVKRANGTRISRTPYGYDLGPDGKSLIENLEELAVIQDILDMRSTGLSYQAIATILTDKAVPTKRGNGRWHQATINGLVKRHSKNGDTRHGQVKENAENHYGPA